MQRMDSNYQTLHILKTTEPKLRKSIISNCDKELVNSISECILNFLKCNVKFSGCKTRKLGKHKAIYRNAADKRVPFSSKKKLIIRQSIFLVPLLSAVLPTIACLIFSRPHETK